jgi:hypothetical protein
MSPLSYQNFLMSTQLKKKILNKKPGGGLATPKAKWEWQNYPWPFGRWFGHQPTTWFFFFFFFLKKLVFNLFIYFRIYRGFFVLFKKAYVIFVFLLALGRSLSQSKVWRNIVNLVVV